MDSCIKHPHEHGISHCGRCGGSWCADCLVHAHGAKKPPLCMSCAMFSAGVRTHPDRPALGRRELKALAKAADAAPPSGNGPVPPPSSGSGPTGGSQTEPRPDPTTEEPIDWSASWWESDREPTLTD